MKLEQFKKKVIKEFVKSPAKTVVLIALCPVALYFVVPLCLPKSQVNESQKIKVIASNDVPAATPLTNVSSPLPLRTGPTWQQLDRWIESDWRRTPATVSASQRNPFQPTVIEGAAVETVTEPEPQVVSTAMSQEAFAAMGFKLSGTLVGRKTRSATINGKLFMEGTPVTESEPIVLLKHVGMHHAILELNGQPFRLERHAAPSHGADIKVLRQRVSAVE